MLRNIFIVIVLVVAGMLAFHHSLQNGSLLRYLDEHPDPKWVPTAEYFIGQGYYMTQELTEASTFFIRVADRFPSSRYAEDAYYSYVQCMDDSVKVGRAQIIDLYQSYLERYPNGRHTEIVKTRLDGYKTGTR
jgi:TolA-binding protein